MNIVPLAVSRRVPPKSESAFIRPTTTASPFGNTPSSLTTMLGPWQSLITVATSVSEPSYQASAKLDELGQLTTGWPLSCIELFTLSATTTSSFASTANP